jgi:hypothetical protein
MPITQDILDALQDLDETYQQQVLDFIRTLPHVRIKKSYTARELLQMPLAERNRLAIEALERTANDDVELFEVWDEADFDDDAL